MSAGSSYLRQLRWHLIAAFSEEVVIGDGRRVAAGARTPMTGAHQLLVATLPGLPFSLPIRRDEPLTWVNLQRQCARQSLIQIKNLFRLDRTLQAVGTERALILLKDGQRMAFAAGLARRRQAQLTATLVTHPLLLRTTRGPRGWPWLPSTLRGAIDAVFHLDETTTVKPFDVTGHGTRHELPGTYPFGL